MSRSVDKIERVVFSVKKIVHLYGVALDSDATLTLEIHVIEHLCLKVFFGYGMGIFQQAVGQGAFAMVDMGDYAEISDSFHSVQS